MVASKCIFHHTLIAVSGKYFLLVEFQRKVTQGHHMRYEIIRTLRSTTTTSATTPENNDIIGLRGINNHAARATRILAHFFALLSIATT